MCHAGPLQYVYIADLILFTLTKDLNTSPTTGDLCYRDKLAYLFLCWLAGGNIYSSGLVSKLSLTLTFTDHEFLVFPASDFKVIICIKSADEVKNTHPHAHNF